MKYFVMVELMMMKTDGKENILRNALNEIFCSQLHLVLAEAIFYQYIRIDWRNKIQNFTMRNICIFVHKYEAISSSLMTEHNVISKYFLYIHFIWIWRNSEMSQILEAPILQSGVISASQGKEDWSQNYSAVNPKHLIEHWAHTWK